MSKRKIIGLLMIVASGVPSITFAEEAAWWTRHKQVCELPVELTYDDWQAQGSPCELYAIAVRKEKERAARKAIRDAEKAAQKKIDDIAKEKARKEAELIAQEAARKKEVQLAQERARKQAIKLAKKKAREEKKRIAQEAARKRKIELAEEKARKKEIKLARKKAIEEGKRLAREAAQKRKIELAEQRARQREIELAEARAREEERLAKEKAQEQEQERLAKDKAREEERLAKEKAREEERLAKEKARREEVQFASDTAVNSQPITQTPDRSREVSAAASFIANQPNVAAAERIRQPQSGNDLDQKALLTRMVKYHRSLEGFGEVAAEVCQGLELCDGSANMPLKLSVSESADAKFYFGVPLAENAPEILIMVESGSTTEVYLTDLNGNLSAWAINDRESDRVFNYEEVTKGFGAALAWFIQAASKLEPG